MFFTFPEQPFNISSATFNSCYTVFRNFATTRSICIINVLKLYASLKGHRGGYYFKPRSNDKANSSKTDSER